MVDGRLDNNDLLILPPPDGWTGSEAGYVLVSNYHALWKSLHEEQNADDAWFSSWREKVPNVGCSCRSWLDEWIKSNPPIYGDGWYDWTVKLHNAVNVKKGVAVWTKPG